MVLHYVPNVVTGQTQVSLPFAFVVGSDELLVFYNGAVQLNGRDYDEDLLGNSITFRYSLLSTDNILVLKLESSGSGTSERGVITSANIINGIIYVSFVTRNREIGVTDLVFEVRDPDNIQAAVDIPLVEYHGMGVYYGQVNVGLAKLGPHLVQVSSVSKPDNSDVKIFTVAPTAGGGSSVIQEATRPFGETFVFRHIAQTTLGDVKITVYNSNDVPINTNQPMIEIGNTGVYKYSFNPASAGLYTGIMSSSTANSKSVTEVRFIVGGPSGGSSTVISNKVGVGKRSCD